MPILDGVFISKAYRKQGWGTAMIDDLVNVHFPGQDVGFSQPISVSLESGNVEILLLHEPQMTCASFLFKF
jgi:hypothetical protein